MSVAGLNINILSFVPQGTHRETRQRNFGDLQLKMSDLTKNTVPLVLVFCPGWDSLTPLYGTYKRPNGVPLFLLYKK